VVNHTAYLPVRLVGSSGPGSTDSLLRSEPGEQDSNPALGRIGMLLASPQRGTEIGQFCTQSLAIIATGAVAHVSASRPDLHQTFGSEYSDGGLHRVQRNPVGNPELAVRRYPATWWACLADDLGLENTGEAEARKTVQTPHRTTTITKRPKTNTDCRQFIGEDLAVPDRNCPREAEVRFRPTRPWPAHRCLSCGTAVNGGPVAFRCGCYGRGLQAADRVGEGQPLGRLGRAG
jgi:hypothetical protein